RPEQRYTLAFVGYGDERTNAVLELTWNYGVERYDVGTGYGHVAIEVDDAARACDAVRASVGRYGGAVTRDRSRAARRSLLSCRTPTVTRSSSSRSGNPSPASLRSASARQVEEARSSSRRSCANTSGPWPLDTNRRSRPCGSNT